MLFFKKTKQEHSRYLPSFSQWSQFLKILTTKEKVIFFFLIIAFTTSLTYSVFNFYYQNTEIVPANYETLRYGIIGQPQFINPLYAQSSETDKSLLELMFSGLMKYDKSGNPVPDLIKDYNFTDEGKTFEFSLKDNIKWHDGQPLTIDDVIFTIELIQDPSYLSPLYPNWSNIEAIKMSENKGIFKLKQPYNNFIDNLSNLKIMPKHVWSDMSAQTIFKSERLNIISPIGSGPYKAKSINQNKDGKIRIISLEANKNYYEKKSYIQNIEIFFLSEKKDPKTNNATTSSKKELLNLLKIGALDGGFVDNGVEYNEKEFANSKKYNIKNTDYFAIFFNTQNDLLSNKKIRQALNLATNKQELLSNSKTQGYIINSPILSEFYNFPAAENTPTFDLEKAKKILSEEGFIETNGILSKTTKKTSGFELKHNLEMGDSGAEVKKLQECLAKDKDIYPDGTANGNFGNGTKEAVIAFQEKYADEILKPSELNKGTGKVMGATLKKLNTLCFTIPEEQSKTSITIKTIKNTTLENTAETIKEQWKKIGIDVKIEALDSSDIKKTIIKKDYDAILFGERFSSSPDLLPYWHSSQIFDPGWNLSVYQNKDLDKILEKSRLYSNGFDNERIKLLSAAEKILIEETPAIFLYSTDYIYILNNKIKGFSIEKSLDQSKIFNDMPNWYISEKRIWKK